MIEAKTIEGVAADFAGRYARNPFPGAEHREEGLPLNEPNSSPLSTLSPPASRSPTPVPASAPLSPPPPSLNPDSPRTAASKKMRFRQNLVRHFGNNVSKPSSSSSYFLRVASPRKRSLVQETTENHDCGSEERAAKRTKKTGDCRALGTSQHVSLRLESGTDKKYHNWTGTGLTNSEQLGSNPSAPYLSYYDICLTTEDIKSLKNDWLTDNNIAFWEEWLEREILPQYSQAKIVLLRPSMTFLLMQSVDVKNIASALPSFDKVTHIFLPVNDNRDALQADGGTHWSLLLVSVIDGVAFHYDSLGGSNFFAAQKCTDRLSKVLGLALRFFQMEDCPQQENSIDCGVFVCILMRHLLIKRLLNANSSEKVSMAMAGKMVDSYSGRKEMLKIIEALRKEATRRRSVSPMAPGASKTPPRID